MNDLYRTPRDYGKPQPGYFAKHMKKVTSDNTANNTRLTCLQVMQGVKADNSHISVMSIKEGLTKRCPEHHYKGFLMVSPGNDYHFARQDNRLITVYRWIHHDAKAGKLKIPSDPVALARMFVSYAEKHIPSVVLIAHQVHPRMMSSRCPVRKLRAISKCAYTWSHKPGGTNATDLDADKNIILNPMQANWNYGRLNYNHMCCFLSIPSNTYANTYSTGTPVGAGSKVTNSSNQLRTNINREEDIDGKYEKLLKKACAGTSSQRPQK